MRWPQPEQIAPATSCGPRVKNPIQSAIIAACVILMETASSYPMVNLSDPALQARQQHE
jgi:hypothetical protein